MLLRIDEFFPWVQNNQAEIREAEDLWGKATWETEDLLRREIKDDRVREALIKTNLPAGHLIPRWRGVKFDETGQNVSVRKKAGRMERRET